MSDPHDKLALAAAVEAEAEAPRAGLGATAAATGSELPAYGFMDTSFRAAGGEDGVRQLVDDFYRVMGEIPEAQTILRMHPSDLAVSRDKLTRFLCGWLGGPKLFSEKYGPIRIPVAHTHLRIGVAEHDMWLLCMHDAIALQPFEESFAKYLLEQLRIPAGRVLAASKDPIA